jgi:hypothetical protein
MKKLGLMFILILVIAVLMVPTASASVLSGYNAGFQVQNLSATVANITITFYNQSDGLVADTVTDTIAGSSSNTYFPLNNVPAGFNGSVVISSDQPVAAITNVLGDVGGAGTFTQGSSYSGFSSGGNTVSLPLVTKSFFGIDTWFNVQNAGTSAASVTVAYAGTSCTENATIQPGAAKTFDQSTNGCLPAGHSGAATVTAGASDSIVATAMQVASSGLFAYNGFTSGSTNPVMPLIVSNVFGIFTGIQIQNQGGTSTQVTVSYTPSPGGGNGTACTEALTIAGGASATFSLNAFNSGYTPTTNCNGQYFVGAAKVTGNSANQPLVGIVNQTNFQTFGSAYNSFDPNAATDTLVMPLIMDAFNIWTGFNVLNVGTSATVTCSYSGATAAQNNVATLNAVSTGKLPANFGSGYIGSGTCTASAGGLLLGVVNQQNLVASGDTALTYEAFNQ